MVTNVLSESYVESASVEGNSDDDQWAEIYFDFPLSNFFYQLNKLRAIKHKMNTSDCDCLIVNLGLEKSNDMTLTEIVFENLFSRILPVRIIYRNLTEDLQLYYKRELDKRNRLSSANKLLGLLNKSDSKFRSLNADLVQYLQDHQLLVIFHKKIHSKRSILNSLNKVLDCHMIGDSIFLKLEHINEDIIQGILADLRKNTFVKLLNNIEIENLIDKMPSIVDYKNKSLIVIQFNSYCVLEEFKNRLEKVLISSLKESQINIKNYMDVYLGLKILDVSLS